MQPPIILGLAVVVLMSGCSPTSGKRNPPSTPFEACAILALSSKEIAKDGLNQTFRCVALRMPFAYALDRQGDLYVFKVEGAVESRQTQFVVVPHLFINLADKEVELVRTPVAHIPSAGDGNATAIYGDVLVCTRRGKLVTFSLADPAHPKRLGEHGQEADQGTAFSIVANGKQAIVVGDGEVLFYDMANPNAPSFVTRYVSQRELWCGCVKGKHLFVGAVSPRSLERKPQQRGIAVLDIADPRNVREVGFLALKKDPHELAGLPDGRVLASLEGNGSTRLSRSGDEVAVSLNGTAVLIDVAQPEKPKVVAEVANAGGRTSAVISISGQTHLVCRGLVYTVEGNGLKECFRFYPHGSDENNDSPYHGAVNAEYVAIAGDECVTVLRVKKAK